MSTPRFVVGSVEFLKVQVTADVSIENTETVEIMVNGTWLSATWLGNPGSSRVARTLVDFGTLAPGTHKVYVRLSDMPEVPILDAGPIRVAAPVQ